MANLKDFFEIDTNDVPLKKPINRNAFTLEDLQYKLKWIKAMQQLGEVTIDEIGNLCLTLPGKNTPTKASSAFLIQILLTTADNLTDHLAFMQHTKPQKIL